MIKNPLLAAQVLVEYMSSLDNFVISRGPVESYNHMGAILTDAILQAGLNYKSVVVPRVRRVIDQYPSANTTSKFLLIIEEQGAGTVLKWNHPEKPRRLLEITRFFHSEFIDTEADLENWLARPDNCGLLLNLRGIGPKTIDYLKNLVNISTVAVDRHIRRFVSNAGITYSGYEEIRTIVESAAELLEVRSSWLDHSIWMYMSQEMIQKKSEGLAL
jgi:endonuclease III